MRQRKPRIFSRTFKLNNGPNLPQLFLLLFSLVLFGKARATEVPLASLDLLPQSNPERCKLVKSGQMSFGGDQYKNSYYNADYNNLYYPCKMTFNTGKKYKKFVALIGIPDHIADRECHIGNHNEYTDILVNGESAAYLFIGDNYKTIKSGNAPVYVELDVSHAVHISFRLRAGCGVGFPHLIPVNDVATPTPPVSSPVFQDITAIPSNVFTNGCENLLPMPEDSDQVVIQLESSMKRKSQMADDLQRIVFIAPFKWLGFEDAQCGKKISNFLLEDLISAMGASTIFTAVERDGLEAVLKEQKFQNNSGLVDEKTAREISKKVGANTVLAGSVSKRGDSLIITARLVDVEKGVILTSAKVVSGEKINQIPFGTEAEVANDATPFSTDRPTEVEPQPEVATNPNAAPTGEEELVEEEEETVEEEPVVEVSTVTAGPGDVWYCVLDKQDGSKRGICRGCGHTEQEARLKAAKTCNKTKNPNCYHWASLASHTNCEMISQKEAICDEYTCSNN